MFAFFIFLFVEIDIEDCVTNSTLSLSHYAVQFHGLRNSFVVSSLYFEQAMMYRVLHNVLLLTQSSISISTNQEIKKAKINKFGFYVLSVWICIIKLTFDVYIVVDFVLVLNITEILLTGR
jgi:hypothetical protein